MAGSAERAINMALRVRGIGEVERDFRKVGKAGEEGFDRVEKAANGADRTMSEYTARLRRVAAEAKRAFDNVPGVAGARAVDPSGYLETRNDVILQRVNLEKQRIQQGLPEVTQEFGGLGDAVDRSTGSLTRFAARGSLVAGAAYLLKRAIGASAEAYMEHEQVLAAFNAELALTGNQSQTSARQIESMAARLVGSTLQTEESALNAAQALATIPGITAEGMQEALEASALLADALGTDVAETAEQTAEVLRALAEGDMAALLDATEGLRPSLRAAMLQLAETGSTADAQRVYLEALRDAAGDGPDGLTAATNRLADKWNDLKVAFAERFEGAAVTSLDLIAGALSRTADESDSAAFRFTSNIRRMSEAQGGRFTLGGAIGATLGGYVAPNPGANDAVTADTGFAQQFLAARAERDGRRTVRDFESRYGSASSRSSGGSGRRASSGQSAAEREAAALQRDAERARAAADRVREANDDVVASYLRRATEAEDKIGLEGAALEAVERRHAIEAVLRRINTDEIENEVAARRAEAAAAGEGFDAAAATDAATRAVQSKSAALRQLAERELDAAEATALFARRQAEAAVLLDNLQSPLDLLNNEVEHAIDLLRAGTIEAEEFDRRMDQLAEGFADVAYSADEGAQAWKGFGYQVGSTLSDIIMNGGSAREILQELIRMPLERLLDRDVTNPVADWIDSLTGNSRADNVATARAGLPGGEAVAGASVGVLGSSAEMASTSLTLTASSAQAAARGLGSVALAAGNPIDELALQSESAAAAMGGLIPVTGQFGSVLAQVLAQLSGGSGGGLLSSAVTLGLGLAGGGGSSLAKSAGAAIDANPALFASGTDRLPTGRPFWVGENGRELMEKDSAGNISVFSNQQARRMASAGGGVTINQTYVMPERADPRRTQSSVNRGTQRAISVTQRKNLA